MAIVYRMQTDSEIGKLTLISSEMGLSAIFFSTEAEDDASRFINKYFESHEMQQGGEHNRHAAQELSKYFSGSLKLFSVRLDIQSRGFRRQVHNQVAKIPFGKTKTYGQIAVSLDKPKAARAVGSASGANTIPIIIPCHRVVAVNGLGGYAGGLDLKRTLLTHEGSLNELGL